MSWSVYCLKPPIYLLLVCIHSCQVVRQITYIGGVGVVSGTHELMTYAPGSPL